MTNLLVVYQSRSGGTRALTDALVAGATNDEIEDVEVRSLHAFDADSDDVRWADGIVFATPAHFGYMSGAHKDLLERVYYEVIDETRGLPYVLVVKGSTDVDGAIASVRRIVAGLEWREAQPPLSVVGDVDDQHLAAARELGMTMAAGLEMGIY